MNISQQNYFFAECSLPLEFCEFMPEAVLQRCRAWRSKNQDLLEQEGVNMGKLSLGKLFQKTVSFQYYLFA